MIPDPGLLTTREALRARLVLRDDDPLTTPTDSSELRSYFDALTPALRVAHLRLFDEAATKTALPAPIHETWVEREIGNFPEAFHQSLRPVLQYGASNTSFPDWITVAAQTVFPRGPTHLRLLSERRGEAPKDWPVSTHSEAFNLAGLGLMEASELLARIDRLGLRTLAATLHNAPKRRLAALMASMEERTRAEFLELLRSPRPLEAPLLRETQLALLRVPEGSPLAGRCRRLGVSVLGYAAGLRFDMDIEFLAFRLPIPVGNALRHALARGSRHPDSLVRDARALVAASVSE